jgi:hypothetical protein
MRALLPIVVGASGTGKTVCMIGAVKGDHPCFYWMNHVTLGKFEAEWCSTQPKTAQAADAQKAPQTNRDDAALEVITSQPREQEQ